MWLYERTNRKINLLYSINRLKCKELVSARWFFFLGYFRFQPTTIPYFSDILSKYIHNHGLISLETPSDGLLDELSKPYINLPPIILMHIVKPLFGIPEAGIHWLDTWTNHSIKKLGLRSACFDPCLLFTQSIPFDIMGMPSDDILFIGKPKISLSLKIPSYNKPNFLQLNSRSWLIILNCHLIACSHQFAIIVRVVTLLVDMGLAPPHRLFWMPGTREIFLTLSLIYRLLRYCASLQ